MTDKRDPYHVIKLLSEYSGIYEKLLVSFYEKWKQRDVADHPLFKSTAEYFERDPDTFGEPNKKGIIIAVCGGRNYRNSAFIHSKLDWVMQHYGRIQRLVHCGDRGADRIALEWAIKNRVIHRPYRPDFTNDGSKQAPFIRNSRLLRTERPSLLVSFPDVRGNDDLIRKAIKQGVLVLNFKEGANA